MLVPVFTYRRDQAEPTMGNLLAELRRRKVFRVAALYATFALLLLVVGFQMGELFLG
jgi:cell division septal protein FtsQ